jgi:hypothetical protein
MTKTRTPRAQFALPELVAASEKARELAAYSKSKKSEELEPSGAIGSSVSKSRIQLLID